MLKAKARRCRHTRGSRPAPLPADRDAAPTSDQVVLRRGPNSPSQRMEAWAKGLSGGNLRLFRKARMKRFTRFGSRRASRCGPSTMRSIRHWSAGTAKTEYVHVRHATVPVWVATEAGTHRPSGGHAMPEVTRSRRRSGPESLRAAGRDTGSSQRPRPAARVARTSAGAVRA